MVWFAVAPFLIFAIFLFGLKQSMIKSTLFALCITTILSLVIWKMPYMGVINAAMKGTFTAFDILLIVFGALFFLRILEENKTIDHLCRYLETVSVDYRVQTILLAWFLESFLEGIAGFGTPLTIVAPLLVGIGLSPMKAVVIALAGNSTAGMFGAVGTPIRVGFAGLDIGNVAEIGAKLNFIGILIPIFMLWLVTEGRKQRGQEFWQGLPIAVASGFAFVGISFLTVNLGQEMASIVGSLAGLGLIIATMKIWQPKNLVSFEKEKILKERIPMEKVIFPYLLLVGLLALGKYALGANGIVWNFGIRHVFQFFNPGFAFIIAGLLVAKKNVNVIISYFKDAWKNSLPPFLVIAAMSTLVQMMTFSGMIFTLAHQVESVWLPVFTPFIGALGAFLTGSVTVSNVMFGRVLATAAMAVGINYVSILALQITGAVAGNMIAIADVLPAATILGLKHREREIILKVVVYALAYVVLTAIVGMIWLTKWS